MENLTSLSEDANWENVLLLSSGCTGAAPGFPASAASRDVGRKRGEGERDEGGCGGRRGAVSTRRYQKCAAILMPM